MVKSLTLLETEPILLYSTRLKVEDCESFWGFNE